MQKNQAFTLIELLVVVLIIGILAAVALPQYQVAVTKSRYATLKKLVKSIAAAQEVYFLAHGEYANTFDSLDIDMPSGKLENSNSRRYYYDWGDCDIGVVMDYDVYFNCNNSKIKMRYQIYPPHAPLNSGVRLCTSNNKDLSSPQVKVCRQETGKENYNWDVNGGLHWFY